MYIGVPASLLTDDGVDLIKFWRRLGLTTMRWSSAEASRQMAKAMTKLMTFILGFDGRDGDVET